LAIAGKALDERSRLWTLRRAGAEVCCEAPLLRGGVEGRIVWNGSELYAFVFPDDRELWAWANEKRVEGSGFRPESTRVFAEAGETTLLTARGHAALASWTSELRS